MNVRKLAEITGYSVATISRVLRGDPSVSSVAAEKITREISRSPFYPDLKKKKKRLRNFFVFLSPGETRAKISSGEINFYSRVFSGVKSAIDGIDSADEMPRYLVLVSFCHGRLLEKIWELEKASFAKNIAGVFLMHTNQGDDRALSEYEGDLLLYLLGRNRHEIGIPDANCIYFDNTLVGKLAYEHLSTNGHNEILVVSGPPGYGYLSMREEPFRQSASPVHARIENVSESDDDQPYHVMQEVFEGHGPHPSAVYITAEYLLGGILRYLDEKGHRIPEDISVLSTNDFLLAYQHRPAISVIRTPSFEIGEIAARIAFQNTLHDYAVRVDYCLDVKLNDRGSVNRLA